MQPTTLCSSDTIAVLHVETVLRGITCVNKCCAAGPHEPSTSSTNPTSCGGAALTAAGIARVAAELVALREEQGACKRTAELDIANYSVGRALLKWLLSSWPYVKSRVRVSVRQGLNL